MSAVRFLFFLLVIALTGCGGASPEAEIPVAQMPVGAASNTIQQRVLLQTTHGDITLSLNREQAPLTVDNFINYVLEEQYSDTIFHRVINGFMIQGGGFTTEYVQKPTHDPVANEADNGLINARYTIAMARTADPHSATAQFFINVADNYFLDYTAPTISGWGYTVFGVVVDGFDTVERIAAVATGAGGPFNSDVPGEPVVILSAQLM